MSTLRTIIIAWCLFGTGAVHAGRLTHAPLVDVPWLARHLGDASLVIIDLRDAVQGACVHCAGHVPGSVSAPYARYDWREQVGSVPGMLPAPERIAARIGALGVDRSRHVVLVSDGADPTEFGKATRVYWTFRVLGHAAVSILDGGYRAWVAAGQSISTERTTPVPATFDIELQPDLLAGAAQVRDAIVSEVQLVDARAQGQYRGLELPANVQRAGTLPTALNLAYRSFYDGTGFADSATVATLSAAAGVDPSRPVIAFCNVGHWASITWFALSEVAGYRGVSMYDGSMAEWTIQESNPVVVLY